MMKIIRPSVVAPVILLLSILTLSSYSAAAAPLERRQAFVTGELLVKFKPTVSTQTRQAAVSSTGGTVQATLERGLTHVRLATGQSVDEAALAYGSDPNVEYVQPNYIYHKTAVPNDPSYGQQWAFANTAQTVTSANYSTHNPGTAGADMNMQLAWNQITDCSSVVVAVIDTGINYNHQDLSSNMWNGGATYPNHGYNFTSEGAANDPMDLDGHGTHVAGMIGAVGNNALGVAGVCWVANIMAVRVLDSTGSGTTSSIISGINFAVANGAKVINMSLGGGGSFDQAYSNAITNAQSNDVVVVVAAGNDTLNNDLTGNAFYPCNFTHSNLICVAALDQSYALASFSDWGATSVDVGAPGTNVLSSFAGTATTYTDTMNGSGLSWSGTGGIAYGTTVPNTFPYNGGTYYSLNVPGVASWPTGYAAANTTVSAYTALNLSSYDAATLDVFGAAHVVSDSGAGNFSIAYRTTGGSPFSGSPTYFSGWSPAATEAVPATVPTFFALDTISLSVCNKSANCSVGFQLKTGATTTNLGMCLVGFKLNLLTLNNTTYKLENGTSMASPAVAGLATMLRAYNPQYTYADVVASIKNSGRAVASLSGKTTTGKAVDAMKSLAYINAPTGLSAAVQ